MTLPEICESCHREVQVPKQVASRNRCVGASEG